MISAQERGHVNAALVDLESARSAVVDASESLDAIRRILERAKAPGGSITDVTRVSIRQKFDKSAEAINLMLDHISYAAESVEEW